MTTSTEAVPSVHAPELDQKSVMSRASSENFPVASFMLPRAYRRHLLAVYGYARLIDEIGDRASGGAAAERLGDLDWAEAEITRALEGKATDPVFVAAGETARAVGARLQPFLDLIEANRIDQRKSRYADFGELMRYCSYSANPVGRLVLAIFGTTSELAAGYADAVCSALQLVEHWQDVVEDFHAGRIYLPAEDLTAFAVAEEMLAGPVTAELQRLMAFEVGRAKALLLSGLPLLSLLPGFGRVAVAGFCGGGLAQIDALETARYDVFTAPVKASKPAVARWSLALAARGGR